MRKILILLLSIISLTLISCDSSGKKAQVNVRAYLEDSLFQNDKVLIDKFSQLYILSPQREDNIPKPDILNENNEGADYINLYCSPLRLTLHGCTPEVFSWIEKNNAKFETWKTNGKEFAMLCFFTVQTKYLDEEKTGLCFVLDSALNVKRPYQIHDINTVYKLVKN